MTDKIQSFLDGVWDTAVDQLLPAVLIFAAGVVVIRLGLRLVRGLLEKSKLEKAAHSLILSVLKAVAYVLLALMVASRMGVDVSGVIALASVLTLAVSLAVENALANVFGGFTLLYTQPFRSGDFVEIAGQSGTVEEIGLAYTKLTTPDNKMISIPNSAVTAAQIVNYSATGTRRIDFVVSASYDSPMARVLEALRQAAQVEGVLAEPAPMAAVQGYDESTIRYVMQVWVSKEQYWDVNFTINRRIKECFDENGVEMSYPHLNVHVDK